LAILPVSNFLFFNLWLLPKLFFMSNKVDNKKVVSLAYELRLDQEGSEVVDQAAKDKPLTFLYGAGQLLPAFEANIKDLNKGDSFAFQLSPTDGYGEVEEQFFVELPKNIFVQDGKVIDELQVGNYIPMTDPQGNQLQGKVVAIGEETVTMDFNHPLAGRTLFFSGEIVDVRDATPEELEHGHAH